MPIERKTHNHVPPYAVHGDPIDERTDILRVLRAFAWNFPVNVFAANLAFWSFQFAVGKEWKFMGNTLPDYLQTPVAGIVFTFLFYGVSFFFHGPFLNVMIKKVHRCQNYFTHDLHAIDVHIFLKYLWAQFFSTLTAGYWIMGLWAEKLETNPGHWTDLLNFKYYLGFVALEFFGITIMGDFIFWFIHVMEHTMTMYKNFHKYHHVAPHGFGSEFHFFDGLLGYVGILIIPLHIISYFHPNLTAWEIAFIVVICSRSTANGHIAVNVGPLCLIPSSMPLIPYALRKTVGTYHLDESIHMLHHIFLKRVFGLFGYIDHVFGTTHNLELQWNPEMNKVIWRHDGTVHWGVLSKEDKRAFQNSSNGTGRKSSIFTGLPFIALDEKAKAAQTKDNVKAGCDKLFNDPDIFKFGSQEIGDIWRPDFTFFSEGYLANKVDPNYKHEGKRSERNCAYKPYPWEGPECAEAKLKAYCPHYKAKGTKYTPTFKENWSDRVGEMFKLVEQGRKARVKGGNKTH